jgi:hypothetical protein
MNKNYCFSVFMFFVSSWCFSQNAVFNYDAAGNQIIREYVDGDPAPNNRNAQTEDFVKFHPEDDFKYYPNPVEDVLQLQWQTINRSIKQFVLYNIKGQVLQQIDLKPTDQNYSIRLDNYEKGTYLLHILYTDEDIATVKIMKK